MDEAKEVEVETVAFGAPCSLTTPLRIEREAKCKCKIEQKVRNGFS